MNAPDHGMFRAFGFTGSHFHKNWQHDDHSGVVLNAIAWIANFAVPTDGVGSKTPTDEEMSANLDKKGVEIHFSSSPHN